MSSAKSLKVAVVTGLSGAGKSTALNALEDLGYYCVDNLPPPVFIATLEALSRGGYERVAVCMDVRGSAYLDGLAELLHEVVGREEIDASVIYLDAPEELLARRFSATRRPHPLSRRKGSEVRAVMDGIRLERELLAPVRAASTVVLDTAGLTVHDLRREVLKMFHSEHSGTDGKMFVRLVSFGFKYGTPRDADMVFDVRFLPNPYFDPDLKPLSGKDPKVADYVLSSADAQGFVERVEDLLGFCVPRFEVEGKSYVTIAIGCTGGRHRSVALTEKMAEDLAQRLGLVVDTVHRDIRQAEHIADSGEQPRSQSSEALETTT